jgi:hypothetical protein
MRLGKLSRADFMLIFSVMGRYYDALELAVVDVVDINYFRVEKIRIAFLF